MTVEAGVGAILWVILAALIVLYFALCNRIEWFGHGHSIEIAKLDREIRKLRAAMTDDTALAAEVAAEEERLAAIRRELDGYRKGRRP